MRCYNKKSLKRKSLKIKSLRRKSLKGGMFRRRLPPTPGPKKLVDENKKLKSENKKLVDENNKLKSEPITTFELDSQCNDHPTEATQSQILNCNIVFVKEILSNMVYFRTVTNQGYDDTRGYGKILDNCSECIKIIDIYHTRKKQKVQVARLDKRFSSGKELDPLKFVKLLIQTLGYKLTMLIQEVAEIQNRLGSPLDPGWILPTAHSKQPTNTPTSSELSAATTSTYPYTYTHPSAAYVQPVAPRPPATQMDMMYLSVVKDLQKCFKQLIYQLK